MIPQCLVDNLSYLARRFHEMYNDYMINVVKEEGYEPQTWEELGVEYQYSNVRLVEGIDDKLRAIGCHVMKRPDDVTDLDVVEEFGPDEILILAKMEHRLWMEEKEKMGWIYGPKTKRKEKTHKDMRPWSSLSEMARKKDEFLSRCLISVLKEKDIIVCREAKVKDPPKFIKYHKRKTIPLILSVTGHTDVLPREKDHIISSLDTLLANLLRKDIHGNCFERDDIILMCALAEGADRIVARWALKNGIHVAPVIPVGFEEYEDTFRGVGYEGYDPNDSKSSEQARKASIRDFESFFGRDRVYSPVFISNEKRNRSRAFSELSAYMVSNSHILIGIWDGRQYGVTGGTYDTIRMAYEGVDHSFTDSMPATSPVFDRFGTKDLALLNAGEDTLIMWIEVERGSTKEDLVKNKFCIDSEREPKHVCGYFFNEMFQVFDDGATTTKKMSDWAKKNILSKEEQISKEPTVDIESGSIFGNLGRLYQNIPEAFGLIFDHMREINREIKDFNEMRGSRRKRRYGNIDRTQLYGDATSASNNPVVKNGCMSDMEGRFLDMFSISEKYKKQRNKETLTVAILQVFVAAAFSFMILFSGSMLLNIIYAVLTVMSSALMWGHKSRKTHIRYIEYRSISESIRVQLFWGILGVNDTVSMNCYGYLKNGMSWVRSVLKSYCSVFANNYYTSSSVERMVRINFIKRYWIGEKKKYLENNEREKLIKFERKTKLISIFEVISVGLALVLSAMSIAVMQELDAAWYTFDGKVFRSWTLITDIDVNISLIVKITMIMTAFCLSLIIALKSQTFVDTPQQSQAKLTLYELALKKLGDADKTPGVHEAQKEAVKTTILHEIGIQEIDQNNDWVFEFIGKDIEKQRSSMDLKD